MPQTSLFRLAPALLALGCASAAPPVVRTVPMDSNSPLASSWAAVLQQPLADVPPALSDVVRNALAAPTEVRPSTVASEASTVERRLLSSRLLPLALEASADPMLVEVADSLRAGGDPAEVLESAVAEMRARRITCRAYRGVIFGGHHGRPAARTENAFVALEIVYFYIRGHERDVPNDPIHCASDGAPTAALQPQLVPYLAVAAAADPRTVRAAVGSLLNELHR